MVKIGYIIQNFRMNNQLFLWFLLLLGHSLVVVISFNFIIILHFHGFKAFLFPLFSLSFLKFRSLIVLSFLMRSFSCCGPFFFVIFDMSICSGFNRAVLVFTSIARVSVIVFPFSCRLYYFLLSQFF